MPLVWTRKINRTEWDRACNGTYAIEPVLTSCIHYWSRNMRWTQKEIGTGIRVIDFNTPGGFCSCGDAPDRTEELSELLGYQ